MSFLLLVARLVLAVVFGIAGIAKLADPSGSRKSLADFGVPRLLNATLGWLLPVAEVVCALALIPVASAWWAAVGVLILLVSFIVAITISLGRGRKPDCQCFGQLHSSPIGWRTLLRNAVLAGIAAGIVWQGRPSPGASIGDWIAGLGGANSVTATIWIALAGLAIFELWALVHVLRQNGRLLLRIEAVEERLGGSAVQHQPQGLPVNSEAPGFSLFDLLDNKVSLDSLSLADKPLLLLFSEPGCGACDALLPEVAQWQRDYGDRLSIIPISRGTVKENQLKTGKYGIRNTLVQNDREVALAYKVDGTPSAVLVKNARVESSLAVGAEAIRGLVARATLPSPVKLGDLVPSLRLPDLTGKLVDLASLRDRRALILFWSPSCGYCQQMLPDVKTWESSAQKNAPEMVVISAGGLEDNRKQGFHSRVLLDPYYAASHVFNSGGTPSAVMVEYGRVASTVAVGAQAVLALAGNVPRELRSSHVGALA